MPVNDRNQSPRRRTPMNLEGRYGKIGISAVQAAARYSSDRKRRTARSRMLARAQPTTNDGSHRRTNSEPPGPPDSPLQPVAGRSGWAGHLAIEARHYDAPERDVRGWMSHADNFGSTDRTDRHWTRPDEIQKSSRMGNGRQVCNAGAGSRRPPRAGTLCTLAGCVDHAGEKVRAFQPS